MKKKKKKKILEQRKKKFRKKNSKKKKTFPEYRRRILNRLSVLDNLFRRTVLVISRSGSTGTDAASGYTVCRTNFPECRSINFLFFIFYFFSNHVRDQGPFLGFFFWFFFLEFFAKKKTFIIIYHNCS